ncbi:MAG: MarR family transcriptional regulator [Verrucomicrobiota bacterium]
MNSPGPDSRPLRPAVVPAHLDDLPFHLASLHYGFRSLIERLRLDTSLHTKVRPGMASIFFALCEEDNCIIKRLVQRLRIPNATLTGLLDAMEHDGLIERSPCPDDGRAFRVRLTPFARSLEAGMRQRHNRAMEILQAGLGDAEVNELRRLLGRVLANLHADEERSRKALRSERAKLRAQRFARQRRGKPTKRRK